jgi:hypothetical protein
VNLRREAFWSWLLFTLVMSPIVAGLLWWWLN